jgi:hypothetical protein
LRLAAASDGAPWQLVERSLALDPKAGIDSDVVWSSIAWPCGRVNPSSRWWHPCKGLELEQVAAMNRSLPVMRSSRDPRQAEAAVVGVPLQLRAHAYVLGVVFLGAKAPRTGGTSRRKCYSPTSGQPGLTPSGNDSGDAHLRGRANGRCHAP